MTVYYSNTKIIGDEYEKQHKRNFQLDIYHIYSDNTRITDKNIHMRARNGKTNQYVSNFERLG